MISVKVKREAVRLRNYMELKKKSVCFKDDSRGMSFIEIIIVVAIMSIAVGIGGYGVSMVSGRAAEECARNITSTLQHVRTLSMGKYATYAKLYKSDSDGKIYIEMYQRVKEEDSFTLVRQTVVGDKTVEVQCNGGVLDSSGVCIGFDRSTGALTNKVGGDFETSTVGQIVVSKSHTTMYVLIEAVTGKIVVKRV